VSDSSGGVRQRRWPGGISFSKLVYHGTQHRSEAATILTDYGHSPGDRDFFFFVSRGVL